MLSGVSGALPAGHSVDNLSPNRRIILIIIITGGITFNNLVIIDEFLQLAFGNVQVCCFMFTNQSNSQFLGNCRVDHLFVERKILYYLLTTYSKNISFFARDIRH